MCFRIVQPAWRAIPADVPLVDPALVSLRPILGDLHHGNNNLVILFLIVAMYYAWRRGYDIVAGLLLGLATSYKVTPALFFLYFAYKRQWRTVGWGLLGMGIFLLIVPSIVIGPEFNGECLGMWWNRMVTPFVVKGATSPQDMNQSVAAVITRLLTDIDARPGPLRRPSRPEPGVLPPVAGRLPDQGSSGSAGWRCWRSSAGPKLPIAAILGCSGKSPSWC